MKDKDQGNPAHEVDRNGNVVNLECEILQPDETRRSGTGLEGCSLYTRIANHDQREVHTVEHDTDRTGLERSAGPAANTREGLQIAPAYGEDVGLRLAAIGQRDPP